MEILHSCASRSFSGLEQYALDVATDQKKRGLSVGFVVAQETRLEEECQSRGIETIPFNPYTPFWPVRFWPRLRQVLNANADLRVVHLHSTQELLHLSLPLFWARKFNKKPKIILQSHIWINHKKQNPFHRGLYSIVDEVWGSSEAAKKNLVENLPVSSEKIKIIRYGRDVDLISKNFLSRQDARKHFHLPPDGVFLGCVSRVEKSKGIFEFVEAVETVLKTQDIHVVIIGGPSPHDPIAEKYFNDLKTRVNELSSETKNRLHFLGPVPESNRYLKAFDLYVLPSYQETFSLSLLDAQLAGLPVLGSESGGTPDVVLEQRTGWLFKSGSVESLRKKIELALKEKSHWESFGKTAAETVRREYDQKAVFSSILAGYGVGL